MNIFFIQVKKPRIEHFLAIFVHKTVKNEIIESSRDSEDRSCFSCDPVAHTAALWHQARGQTNSGLDERFAAIKLAAGFLV